MSIAASEHSHAESWRSTMDWPDLRSHLVSVHGQHPEAIDDVTEYVDGTAGRRKNAEDRHHALHGTN
jgi:hypothetical protein